MRMCVLHNIKHNKEVFYKCSSMTGIHLTCLQYKISFLAKYYLMLQIASNFIVKQTEGDDKERHFLLAQKKSQPFLYVEKRVWSGLIFVCNLVLSSFLALSSF